MSGLGSFYTHSGSFYPPPNYTSQEVSFYNYLFHLVGGGHALGGGAVVDFLRRSGLSVEILREVWDIASVRKLPELNEFEFFLCLKFVAIVQAGYEPIRQYVNLNVPLPRFAGVEVPTQEEDEFTDFVTADEKQDADEDDFTEFMSSAPDEVEFKVQVPEFVQFKSGGGVLTDWDEIPATMPSECSSQPVTVKTNWNRPEPETMEANWVRQEPASVKTDLSQSEPVRTKISKSEAQAAKTAWRQYEELNEETIFNRGLEEFTKVSVLQSKGHTNDDLIEIARGKRETEGNANGGEDTRQSQGTHDLIGLPISFKETLTESDSRDSQSSRSQNEPVQFGTIDDPFAEIDTIEQPLPTSSADTLPNYFIPNFPRTSQDVQDPQLSYVVQKEPSSSQGESSDQWEDFEEVEVSVAKEDLKSEEVEDDLQSEVVEDESVEIVDPFAEISESYPIPTSFIGQLPDSPKIADQEGRHIRNSPCIPQVQPPSDESDEGSYPNSEESEGNEIEGIRQEESGDEEGRRDAEESEGELQESGEDEKRSEGEPQEDKEAEDEISEEDWDDFKEVSPEPTVKQPVDFMTFPNVEDSVASVPQPASNHVEHNFFQSTQVSFALPDQSLLASSPFTPPTDLFAAPTQTKPVASSSSSQSLFAHPSISPTPPTDMFAPPSSLSPNTPPTSFSRPPANLFTAPPSKLFAPPTDLFAQQPKQEPESPNKKAYDPENVRCNPDLLAEVKITLTEQGRPEEALACQTQLDRVLRLKNLKILKSRAAEQDEYEDAIHLRSRIAEVEACLVGVDEVKEWLKPKQSVNLKSLTEEVQGLFGEDIAKAFAQEYKAAEDLVNIKEAVTTLQAAKRTRSVLRKIQHQVEAFKKQSESMAARLSDEMRKGSLIFATMKSQLGEFAEDAAYQAYCKGLCEVCKVAKRLLSATQLARTFLKLSMDLMTLEADLATLASQLSIKFDDLKDDGLCGLCLGATEEALTTFFNGQYHVTCGNFWLHRVSVNAPRLK